MRPLEQTVLDFLARDYAADIHSLNQELRRNGCAAAGLTEDVPPSVLTGNLFQLAPGACVGVFGINPHCLGIEGEHVDKDVLRSKRQIDRGDYADYIETRATFFDPSDPQYNPHHFDRLIERVQKGVFGYPVRDVPRFGREAFMLDMLPWWSKNVNNLRKSALKLDSPQLAAWKHVVDAVIVELQPRQIIINGSGYVKWAEALFETQLTRFSFWAGRRNPLYGYAGWHGATGVPIFMHAQVGCRAGPQSQEQYDGAIERWLRFVKLSRADLRRA